MLTLLLTSFVLCMLCVLCCVLCAMCFVSGASRLCADDDWDSGMQHGLGDPRADDVQREHGVADEVRRFVRPLYGASSLVEV